SPATSSAVRRGATPTRVPADAARRRDHDRLPHRNPVGQPPTGPDHRYGHRCSTRRRGDRITRSPTRGVTNADRHPALRRRVGHHAHPISHRALTSVPDPARSNRELSGLRSGETLENKTPPTSTPLRRGDVPRTCRVSRPPVTYPSFHGVRRAGR